MLPRSDQPFVILYPSSIHLLSILYPHFSPVSGVFLSATHPKSKGRHDDGFDVEILLQRDASRAVLCHNRTQADNHLYTGSQELPMSFDFIQPNDNSRQKLETFINSLSDDDFAQTNPYGWTVSALLGHLAFWEQRMLVLLRRWQQERRGRVAGRPGYDQRLVASAVPGAGTARRCRAVSCFRQRNRCGAGSHHPRTLRSHPGLAQPLSLQPFPAPQRPHGRDRPPPRPLTTVH